MTRIPFMMEIKSNFFVAQLILVQLVCCAEAFVLLLMGKIHERCAPRSMIGVNNIILRAHLDFWLPVMTSDGLVSNTILVDKFIVLFSLISGFYSVKCEKNMQITLICGRSQKHLYRVIIWNLAAGTSTLPMIIFHLPLSLRSKC